MSKTKQSFATSGLIKWSRQVLFLILIFFGQARAQTATTYQRVISSRVADVRAAVLKMSTTMKGRLPTLEGFVVDQANPSLDRYDKGYYECKFDIEPAVGGGTLVVATSKITAFLNDPSTGASGYRVLLSNGRLENDALDRIEEALAPGTATGGVAATSNSNQASGTAAPAPPAATPLVPQNEVLQPSTHFNLTSGVHAGSATGSLSSLPADGESSSLDSSSNTSARARVPIAPAAPLPTGETLDSQKARRAADEKKSQDLSEYIKNLEEIQRNQARPANLAAVINSKTPVFAKPSESAPVLMNAEAQDEFEVLQVEGAWVHAQISGASRGWIRRSQLDMPAGYAQAANNEAETQMGAPLFKIAKEETSPFSGNWEGLAGRTVRVVWVEPTTGTGTATSSPEEKLTFAKSAFLKAYESLNAAQQRVDGIVVVFDSADGGQIAAGLASVKGLAGKTLTEAAFWRQCSLDPPESFHVSGK